MVFALQCPLCRHVLSSRIEPHDYKKNICSKTFVVSASPLWHIRLIVRIELLDTIREETYLTKSLQFKMQLSKFFASAPAKYSQVFYLVVLCDKLSLRCKFV